MQDLSKAELLKPASRTAQKIVGYGLFFFLTAIGAALFWLGLFGDLAVDKPAYAKYMSAEKQKELRMEAVRQKEERHNLLLIFGAGLMALPAVGFLFYLKEENAREKERALLLEHGQFGDAVIREANVHEDEEEIDKWTEMVMEIRLGGREPYLTEIGIRVPWRKLPDIKIGNRFPVLAAPPVEGVHRGATKLILQ